MNIYLNISVSKSWSIPYFRIFFFFPAVSLSSETLRQLSQDWKRLGIKLGEKVFHPYSPLALEKFWNFTSRLFILFIFSKKFRSRKQRGERRNHTSSILIPSHRRMRYRLSILRDSIPQTFFSKNRFVEAWIWLFPFHPLKSNLFYSNSETWSLLLRRTIIEQLHKYLVISRTGLSMRESTCWSSDLPIGACDKIGVATSFLQGEMRTVSEDERREGETDSFFGAWKKT